MINQTNRTIKTIEVSLYLYDNGGEYIKLLIDKNHILYHYTDHVAIGYLGDKNGVEFYHETQGNYDEARKKKNYTLKRFLDSI
jgi:hypothetical protein